jgi:calcineurin-like phosphoesterase family protein
VILNHLPLNNWGEYTRKSFHLYGHVHSRPENRFRSGTGRSMDVGIDGHPEFRPYEWNEIRELLENK